MGLIQSPGDNPANQSKDARNLTFSLSCDWSCLQELSPIICVIYSQPYVHDHTALLQTQDCAVGNSKFLRPPRTNTVSAGGRIHVQSPKVRIRLRDQYIVTGETPLGPGIIGFGRSVLLLALTSFVDE